MQKVELVVFLLQSHFNHNLAKGNPALPFLALNLALPLSQLELPVALKMRQCEAGSRKEGVRVVTD